MMPVVVGPAGRVEVQAATKRKVAAKTVVVTEGGKSNYWLRTQFDVEKARYRLIAHSDTS
jgi:hypothetical protein